MLDESHTSITGEFTFIEIRVIITLLERGQDGNAADCIINSSMEETMLLCYYVNTAIKNVRTETPCVIMKDYVEVKGYETEIDAAKWSQFPKDILLKVLRRKEIKQLEDVLQGATGVC